MKVEKNPTLTVPKQLEEINMAVNKVCFEFFESKANCILASHALNHVVQHFGYKSRPVRVTTGVFPENDRHHGAVLGSAGDGTRRPAAGLDMWHGHLCVLVEEKWLLDPTLDQLNNKFIHLPPIALELDFLDGRSTAMNLNGCYVRYNLYHKQVGFKHAGDARPSHWMPVAQQAIREIGCCDVAI